MWESSHQHVRVRSAAGSQTRCLLLLCPSPSLSGRLSLYWQSATLRVYTEVWVGPLSRGCSFEMRWWADTEPADPDLLFEVWAPQPHKPLGPSPCLPIAVSVSLSRCIIWTSILTAESWMKSSQASALYAYLPACLSVCLSAGCWFKTAAIIWCIIERHQRTQCSSLTIDFSVSSRFL